MDKSNIFTEETKRVIDFDKLGIPGLVPNEDNTEGHLMVGRELLTVFFFEDEGEISLDVTIDGRGPKGHLDENIAWEGIPISSETYPETLYLKVNRMANRMIQEAISRQASGIK